MKAFIEKYFDRYTLAGALLAFVAWLYLAPTNTVAGIIQAIVPAAVPTAFRNGTGTARFQLTDSSGNLDTAGSITSGLGSGVGGVLDLKQGTLPTFGASNTFSLFAPASIGTSYQWRVPSADAAGCIQSDGGATPGILSIGACGGGGAAGATLFSTTASTTVTAASATTLIGTVTGSTTIPANTFTAGQLLDIMGQGYYSTPAAARTLTINLNIGGSTRITTGAVTVPASVTNGTWQFRCGVTTRTTGGSGSQIANCTFAVTGATLTAPGDFPMQTASTWTTDTTATNVVDIQAAWDATTGSPTITATNVAAWIPGAPVTSVNGMTGAVTVSAGSLTVADPYLQSGGNNYGPIFTVTPPGTLSWSWVNQGSASITNTNQSLYLTAPANASFGLVCRVETIPSAPYTITALILPSITDTNNSGAGMALRDSSGGGIVFWGPHFETRYTFAAFKATSATSFSAHYSGSPFSAFFQNGPVWMRIQDTSGTTNLRLLSASLDGQNWTQFFSVGRTDFITPNQVGFCVDPENGTYPGSMTLVSWKETQP